MTEKKCGNCRGDLPELCKGIWACGDVEKIQTELSQAKKEAEQWKDKADELWVCINDAVGYMERHPENAFLPCGAMRKALFDFQKFKESKEKK